MVELVNVGHEGTPCSLGGYDDTETDGGDMSAHTDAGLAGTSCGMKLVINDANIMFGRCDITVSTSDVRYRFYIDPNSVSMDTDEYTTVVHFGASGDPWHFAICTLHYDGSNYEIDAEAFEDGGATPGTARYDITNAQHYVEVHIQRASGALANDGTLDLWIDGIHKQQVTGIDNYDVFPLCENVRMGAHLYYSDTITGTIYLDQLIVNDDGSEIGPLVGGAVVFRRRMEGY